MLKWMPLQLAKQDELLEIDMAAKCSTRPFWKDKCDTRRDPAAFSSTTFHSAGCAFLRPSPQVGCSYIRPSAFTVVWPCHSFLCNERLCQHSAWFIEHLSPCWGMSLSTSLSLSHTPGVTCCDPIIRITECPLSYANILDNFQNVPFYS